MPTLIRVAVAVLLLWAALEDLRRFRIRNAIVLALVALFGIDCLLGHRLDLVLTHGLFASLALTLALAAYRLKMLGGGDAKLLATAFLWVGPEGATVFAALLLVFTILSAAAARLRLFPSRRTPEGRTLIPFGPGIGAAWSAILALESLDP